MPTSVGLMHAFWGEICAASLISRSDWGLCVALIGEPQSRDRTLGHGLLHAVTVGLRSFGRADRNGAVGVHLEHVVGDGFTDAVACALVQVDIDAHEN